MNRIDRSGLLVLHEYCSYANDLVLDVAGKLSAEELTRPSSPSHGNVQALLLHMLGCEYFFLTLCQGPAPADDAGGTLPLVAEMRTTWNLIVQQRRAYLETVAEADLNEVISFPVRDHVYNLPRWQYLVQSLLHSAHHRGELSIVLTGLGYPLPTLDILIPFIKSSGQEWPWD
jgi:uncharacterized damage-inducible protein DinB